MDGLLYALDQLGRMLKEVTDDNLRLMAENARLRAQVEPTAAERAAQRASLPTDGWVDEKGVASSLS